MSGNDPICITTTPEQAVEFLQRLIEDDGFRERYEEDARGLFAEYGVDIPRSLMPETIEAPPREDLETIRSQFQELASGGEEYFFFIWRLFFFSFLGIASSGSSDSFLGFGPRQE
jgi:hypothetical protein